MGLGSASDVSLKEARESAEKWRAKVRNNQDPIKERERERREAARNMHVLTDVANDAFESGQGRKGPKGSAALRSVRMMHGGLPRLRRSGTVSHPACSKASKARFVARGDAHMALA